jgi:hypothetical protein
MKTLLCYDTGVQLYYEELGNRPLSITTVDLPDGRYKIIESIISPAQFRADNRTAKRTGLDKLVEMLNRSYPGKIAQVARLVRQADNLQKGGLIVPGLPKDGFDDVILFKVELVGALPEKLDAQLTKIHSLLAKAPRRRSSGSQGQSGSGKRPLGKIVLTPAATET